MLTDQVGHEEEDVLICLVRLFRLRWCSARGAIDRSAVAVRRPCAPRLLFPSLLGCLVAHLVHSPLRSQCKVGFHSR